MIMPHDAQQDYWQKVEDERRKYQWQREPTPASTPDRQLDTIFRGREIRDGSSHNEESPRYSYSQTFAPSAPPPPPSHHHYYWEQHQHQHQQYYPHPPPAYDPQYAHHPHHQQHYAQPPPPYPQPYGYPHQHPNPQQYGPNHHYSHPPHMPSSGDTPPGMVYMPQSSIVSSVRRLKEEDDLVYEVRDADVLCGRGAPTNFHPGNQIFRKLISAQQMAYLAAKRVDKPEIALLIVEQIRERGGRFLKRTKRPGLGPSGHFCWQEISGERAYEKTCQSLREGAPELRKRMAIKQLTAVSQDEEDEDSRDEENAAENQKLKPKSGTH